METLLEHKMRTGRVESHTKLVDRSFVNHPPLSQQQSGPPDPLAIDFDPEEPSNSKRPKSPPKGPRTPPGTPPKCTPSPNLHRREDLGYVELCFFAYLI